MQSNCRQQDRQHSAVVAGAVRSEVATAAAESGVAVLVVSVVSKVPAGGTSQLKEGAAEPSKNPATPTRAVDSQLPIYSTMVLVKNLNLLPSLLTSWQSRKAAGAVVAAVDVGAGSTLQCFL